MRSFKGELKAVEQFIQVLSFQFNCKIYYKLGNHEERYQHYLISKAPELFGIPDFKLDKLLNLDRYDVDIIEDKRIIKLGGLNILHGHEFGASVFSPVNPARGYYLRAKASVLCGHNHQTSEHVESNLEGKVVTTWSTGCLCELQPAYMPYNKWNHGFAMVELFEDGGYDVENLKIIKEKIR
jgi:hypothetical protein